jgi:hypothetical protein
MLSTPPEQWDLRAKADRANQQHFYRGRVYDFDTPVWARAPGFANQTTLDVRRERSGRCQQALDVLARRLKQADPDVLVVAGNDQRELFNDSLTPAITVFRGERIEIQCSLSAESPAGPALPGSWPRIAECDQELARQSARRVDRLGRPDIAAMNAEGRRFHKVDYVPATVRKQEPRQRDGVRVLGLGRDRDQATW